MARCPLCHRRVEGGARCPRDAWTAPEAPRSSPADLAAPPLKGFSVEGLLGTGGFASVWAARRLPAAQPVALKVGLSGHALVCQRFRREAEALARAGWPSAPQLYGYGQLEDGRPYLVMERLAGTTLAAWLEGCPDPPAPPRAVAIADAVLAALEAVHARGMVHRDLKPENIFVDETARRATLIDFGLARGAVAGDDTLTRPGTAVGSLEYMAPERLRGDPAEDARVDVYALGAILYELLTLRPPFVGDAAAVEYGHLALRPQRPGELAPVPGPLERVVLACLAKDPARRPASIAALRRDLQEASEAAPEGERPAAKAPAPASAIIAEGRRPVVVLAVETAAPAPAVFGAITARLGRVVRQRGRRYLALFSGAEAEAPIEAALGAAHELAAFPDAGAALHLAKVSIRPRPDGPPAVHGAAVDRPETWMPAGAFRGVVLSPELARVLPAMEAAAPTEPPLLGRGAALAALDASAALVQRGLPALVTVLGDHGLGKSRLAAEAAARFRRAHPAARVISLRAGQAAAGDADRTARELWAELVGAPAEAPPHRLDRARSLAAALRARARERGPFAVVLDDAHWADDATLDALELATLEGSGALWVVVAAHSRLEEARRGWGARAERHDRIALEPLDQASGMELAAALLEPAEYPPAAALAQIHAWADGNPACLVELARALKDAGIIRQRAVNGSHYLATAELERLPASPAWQWLAARQLDAMPRELSACVRLCAVLGADFTRFEVERLQEALERSGEASTPIDAGVGLSTLCERGLLARLGADRFSFRSAVLKDAMGAMLDDAQRARIHRAALELFRVRARPADDDGDGAQGPPALEAQERLAHHAAASGAREEAAAAYLKLGDRARARHHHVAADARYTAALDHLDAADAAGRARAFAGRGKVRYRVLRTAEALEDLATARGLAEREGDLSLLADVMLEESTALDWESDFSGSAARASAARPLIERLADPALERRLLVAEGRAAWRHSRVAEAVALLGRGASAAEATGDYETRVVALLLLSCALVITGQLDEAEARFDEVIALAEGARDGVHLCAAYGNRFFLWSVKKDIERAIDDLRRATELAREVGNPWPERTAMINHAELLFWCGRDDEGLAVARRARALEERFMTRPVQEGSLMLARLHAARGELAEAARLVAWIEAHCPPEALAPGAHTLHRALLLLTAGGSTAAAWDALLTGAGADALVPAERLEMLYWRARAALLAGRPEEAARVGAEAAALFGEESPAWRARFAALGAG